MRYFFTGDWHLWHKKIMLLANRPFATVEEMNWAIQFHINDVITPSDHLVILGDVAFGSVARLSTWLDGLHTKNLHLVWGNHDGTAEKLVKQEPRRFQRVGDVIQFKLPPFVSPKKEAVHIFCSHYAHRVWNKSHWGSYHVYGHSHGSLPDDPKSRSMDVGVDTNGYKPWSLEDIIARLDQKEWKAIDHHVGLADLPPDAICDLCHKRKGAHLLPSLHCPVDLDDYHPTQYFSHRSSS